MVSTCDLNILYSYCLHYMCSLWHFIWDRHMIIFSTLTCFSELYCHDDVLGLLYKNTINWAALTINVYFIQFWGLGSLRPKSRHWQIHCLGRTPFLVCKQPSVLFLQYCHVVVCVWEDNLSHVSSYKDTYPIMRPLSSWPYYLPKGPPQISSH